MTPGRRLRILYLADGRSIHTKRWVGWFAKRHDVLLASVPALQAETWDRSDIPLAAGVPDYKWPLLSSLRIVVRLRRLIAEFQPDFVHAHYLSPNAWIAVASGFPRVVTTTWGSDLMLAGSFASQLNAWALRHAVLNTADSVEALVRLTQIVGFRDRIQLVQFGVDTSVFSPAQPSGELRRAWQIPEAARILVSPRILRPLYNAQSVARAFVQLADRHRDLHLVFLAFNADPEYQRQIESELRTTGHLERVRFAPSVQHPDMPELYRDASAVISVPSSDTTPVTVLEAMSCGGMVIACDLPSLREWVVQDENGFLVPAGDVARLASTIETVLELPSARKATMAAANRRIVVERASQDVEMGRLEDLLRTLLIAS